MQKLSETYGTSEQLLQNWNLLWWKTNEEVLVDGISVMVPSAHMVKPWQLRRGTSDPQRYKFSKHRTLQVSFPPFMEQAFRMYSIAMTADMQPPKTSERKVQEKTISTKDHRQNILSSLVVHISNLFKPSKSSCILLKQGSRRKLHQGCDHEKWQKGLQVASCTRKLWGMHSRHSEQPLQLHLLERQKSVPTRHVAPTFPLDMTWLHIGTITNFMTFKSSNKWKESLKTQHLTWWRNNRAQRLKEVCKISNMSTWEVSLNLFSHIVLQGRTCLIPV